jgi:UDP-galactopyranose mutase
MPATHDILIVGAGLFGATCAYELQKQGFRCLVLEKRDHIAGNCYTDNRDGINVHVFGPHIFHTSNKRIWDWVTQFVPFNHYRHRIKVDYKGRIYSFPPNLDTFNQLWGVRTPGEAAKKLEELRKKDVPLDTLEGWALSQVGQEIYDIFIKGYTQKQWGRPPSSLPASIIKRIPMRLTYDDNYFFDNYQGIPVGGYTAIFQKMLADVEVRLSTDYLADRERFDALAPRTLYTGPIDRFFDFRFGKLEYRSMRFEHERLEIPDFQGVSIVNYTAEQTPFTRIVEHKHFEFGTQPVTWITREYPLPEVGDSEPMYPIRDERNMQMLKQYQSMAEQPAHSHYYMGGRLAEYQYYDMHQAIGAALQMASRIAQDLRSGAQAVKSA